MLLRWCSLSRCSGFTGNFLFDFALNPRAPYTMKMMQDGKDAEKGEQIDAEEGEARAWFKENRESSSPHRGRRDRACRLVFCCVGEHARLRRLPAWIYQRSPSVWPDTSSDSTTAA